MRDTFNKDEKNYSSEYVACLQQRLIWIATSSQSFRRLNFEACLKALSKSGEALNQVV